LGRIFGQTKQAPNHAENNLSKPFYCISVQSKQPAFSHSLRMQKSDVPFSVCCLFSTRLIYGFCRGRLQKREMCCRLVLCAMMSSKGGLKCEKTQHAWVGGGNCSESCSEKESALYHHSNSLPLTKHRLY
jgi:hypothetical protein